MMISESSSFFTGLSFNSINMYQQCINGRYWMMLTCGIFFEYPIVKAWRSVFFPEIQVALQWLPATLGQEA